jgi:hypothetical protein
MKQIVAIDGNAGFSGWISQVINRFRSELDGDYRVVTVYSVQDMVDKVLIAAGGDQIFRLVIEGHGASGFQAVGCGTPGNALKNRSKPDYLEFSDLDGKLRNGVENSLKQLIPKLSKSAVVSLGGCQVGAEPFGPQLLKRMSHALGGIDVEAGFDNQRPLLPGYEGSVIRCSDDWCLVTPASWTY